MSQAFYLDEISPRSSDDLSSLPQPKPISRAAFQDPDFQVEKFLESLTDDHKSLDDIRTELQEQIGFIDQELVNYVNDNYDSFIALGKGVQGGEEKVDALRLNVLSFKREIEGARERVVQDMVRIKSLIASKRSSRREILHIKALMDIERQVNQLEARLLLKPPSAEDNPTSQFQEDIYSDSDESDEEHGTEGDDDNDHKTAKATRHADLYIGLVRATTWIDTDDPALPGLQDRISAIRNTVLLDLGHALDYACKTIPRQGSSIVKLLDRYKEMDAIAHAMEVLRKRTSVRK